jgi:hypothetical protein
VAPTTILPCGSERLPESPEAAEAIVECRLTSHITKRAATGRRLTSRNVMLEVVCVDIALEHVLGTEGFAFRPIQSLDRNLQRQGDSAILTPNRRTKSRQSGAGLLRSQGVQLDRLAKIAFGRAAVSEF